MKRAQIIIPLFILIMTLAACNASGSEESTVGFLDSVAAATVSEDEAVPNAQVENSSDSAVDGAMEPTQVETGQEMVDEVGDVAGEAEDMMKEGEIEEMTAEPRAESEEMSEMMSDGDDMASVSSDEVMMAANLRAWQTLVLTNVHTGQPFTLSDFPGKTVFVEPMATWCSNCRRQLTNVLDAKQQLASDDVIFVALSVETNIGDGDLANYANAAGFDWHFAVMTPEILRELVDEFGQAITNPPATPHFIIHPDSTFTELATGIEPAGQIISQIQAGQG